MESLAIGWIYWILEEDPINLFIIAFTLISLVGIFRMDLETGQPGVWEVQRRLVFCPLQRAEAALMIWTGPRRSERAETVAYCPIVRSKPGYSCREECLRAGALHEVPRRAAVFTRSG